jgi:hypothetical protein
MGTTENLPAVQFAKNSGRYTLTPLNVNSAFFPLETRLPDKSKSPVALSPGVGTNTKCATSSSASVAAGNGISV